MWLQMAPLRKISAGTVARFIAVSKCAKIQRVKRKLQDFLKDKKRNKRATAKDDEGGNNKLGYYELPPWSPNGKGDPMSNTFVEFSWSSAPRWMKMDMLNATHAFKYLENSLATTNFTYENEYPTCPHVHVCKKKASCGYPVAQANAA